jgi:hypothetical protein
MPASNNKARLLIILKNYVIVCGDFVGILQGSEAGGKTAGLAEKPAIYGAFRGIPEPDDPCFNVRRRKRDCKGVKHRINHHTWWTAELPND